MQINTTRDNFPEIQLDNYQEVNDNEMDQYMQIFDSFYYFPILILDSIGHIEYFHVKLSIIIRQAP